MVTVFDGFIGKRSFNFQMAPLRCGNCDVALDAPGLCPACQYLSAYGTYTSAEKAARAREEKLTNRRWQMRFNLGVLK